MERPYVVEHGFLGDTLDKCLTWTLDTRRIKKKTRSFVDVIRMISGTSWRSSVTTRLTFTTRFSLACFVVTFQLSTTFPCSTWKDLESVQAKALRACLGLPECTSNDRTLYEAKASFCRLGRLCRFPSIQLRDYVKRSGWIAPSSKAISYCIFALSFRAHERDSRAHRIRKNAPTARSSTSKKL